MNYPFLTRKERDNETGLDYFLARFYSSAQGGFNSPDEFKGGPEELFGDVDPHNPLFYAEIAEPQSLNKYHYALNNPLRYIDPDGHQTTTADRINQAADFLTGVGRGINSSITLGASGAPQESDSLLNRAGQGVGTILTNVAGRAAFGLGGGATILTAGASSEVSIPAVVVGAEMAVGSALNAVRIATTPMQRSSSGSSGSTLEPGPSAGDSIPARGPQRDFTPAERGAVNKAGQKTGCHTCGSKQPGTKSGNFVPDHQPPTGTNKSNSPQRLYPQCQNCSRKQGGEVRAAKAKIRKEPD